MEKNKIKLTVFINIINNNHFIYIKTGFTAFYKNNLI
jgi:hypothetical protein